MNIVFSGTDIIHVLPATIGGIPVSLHYMKRGERTPSSDLDHWAPESDFPVESVLAYMRNTSIVPSNTVGRLYSGGKGTIMFSLRALVILGTFWETPQITSDVQQLIATRQKAILVRELEQSRVAEAQSLAQERYAVEVLAATLNPEKLKALGEALDHHVVWDHHLEESGTGSLINLRNRLESFGMVPLDVTANVLRNMMWVCAQRKAIANGLPPYAYTFFRLGKPTVFKTKWRGLP